MFQGGFGAKRCGLTARDLVTNQWITKASFYPQDNNLLQTFDIALQQNDLKAIDWMVSFEDAHDLFGRITLYRLELY